MRAIDADALKEDLTRFYDNEVTARKLIDEQPTIQLDIVRCEKCLYRKICSWEKQGAKFCSFAERREETE